MISIINSSPSGINRLDCLKSFVGSILRLSQGWFDGSTAAAVTTTPTTNDDGPSNYIFCDKIDTVEDRAKWMEEIACQSDAIDTLK